MYFSNRALTASQSPVWRNAGWKYVGLRNPAKCTLYIFETLPSKRPKSFRLLLFGPKMASLTLARAGEPDKVDTVTLSPIHLAWSMASNDPREGQHAHIFWISHFEEIHGHLHFSLNSIKFQMIKEPVIWPKMLRIFSRIAGAFPSNLVCFIYIHEVYRRLARHSPRAEANIVKACNTMQWSPKIS